MIHTVDRPEIADRLQFLLEQHWPDRVVDVLLEINVGRRTAEGGRGRRRMRANSSRRSELTIDWRCAG